MGKTVLPGSQIKDADIKNVDIAADAAIDFSKLANVSATSRVLGRKTSGAGAIEELTLSEVLDFIGSASAGDILYRGASSWAKLAKGTDGQVLTLASGLPSWAEEGGGALPSVIIKTSNTSWSSVNQDIPGMSFYAEANKKYNVRLYNTKEVELANGPLKFNIPAGASAVGNIISVWYDDNAYTETRPYDPATSNGKIGLSGVLSNNVIDVIIINGSTAGDVTLRSMSSSGTLYPCVMIIQEVG